MANIKRKMRGFYNLLADKDIASNPIYKGPVRKDLMLDITEHNKIISRLLQSPARREPTCPTSPGEIHDEIDEMLKFKPVMKKTVHSPTVNFVQSLLLFAGYFTLVMCLVLMETELVQLQKVSTSHYHETHQLLIARTVAAAVGALFAGLVIKRVNVWLMMCVCLFTMGAAILSLPFCTKWQIVTLTLTALCGLSMGIYANGSNLTILKIWGKQHGCWLQMLHSMYALACLLTPWIIKAFLPYEHHQPASLSTAPTERDYLFILNKATSVPTHEEPYLFILNVEQKELELSETRKEWLGHQTLKSTTTTTLPTPVMTKSEDTLPLAFIVIAIPIFYMAFSFLFMAFYTRFCLRNKEVSFDKAEIEILTEEENPMQKKSNIYVGLVSFLLFLFYFIFSTVHMIYSHFVSKFAEEVLHMHQDKIQMMNLVFWISLVAGSFLCILLIRLLQPHYLIGGSVTLMLVSILPLMFIGKSNVILVVVTSCFAFSSAGVFATAISWAYQNIPVSGLVGAIFIVTSCAAQVFVPTVGSLCLSILGKMSFVYVIEATTLTMIFVQCALQLVTSKTNKVTEENE